MVEGSAILFRNIAYLLEKGRLSYSSIAWHEIQAGRPVTVNELLFISSATGISCNVLLTRDLTKAEKLDLSAISFIVLDVDGVMTDGGMMFSKNGDEIKKFNSKDGVGLALCKERNIQVGIISAGQNSAIVEKRATMLGIERFYVGKRPKLEVLMSWLNDLRLGPDKVAYIGDDINDIAVMRYVAVSACPSDAAEEVKNTVSIQLRTPGGRGCVREFIDEYLLQPRVRTEAG